MFHFKIKWIKQFEISLTGGTITRMSQIMVTLRVFKIKTLIEWFE